MQVVGLMLELMPEQSNYFILVYLIVEIVYIM